MAAPKQNSTKATSRLARERVARGITRKELAKRTGVTLASLRRLEYEQVPDAPLWWYRNLAIALELDLDEILDERERRWRWTRDASKAPPLGWYDAARAVRLRPNAAD